jgi:hypothetical protein
MGVSRDEMIELIMEALLLHGDFRQRGRNWVRTSQRDTLLARASAVAIVDHLERCGILWSRQPPIPPHSAGE